MLPELFASYTLEIDNEYWLISLSKINNLNIFFEIASMLAIYSLPINKDNVALLSLIYIPL